MDEAINDGKSFADELRAEGAMAFPFVVDGHAVCTGMTLRDYFAAQALAGIAAQYHESWAPDRVGPVCYELADALLAERAK